jgi:CPA2 family monovalent cation:H+ antiporter-2
LLHAAGASEAQFLIAAIDSTETNQRLIENVQKHFPNIKIFSRAKNRTDAYELMEMGITSIYRETLYTAAHLGADVLVALGFRKYTASRQSLKFVRYDEKSLEKLSKKRNNLTEYILTVKEEIEWQEQLLQNDLAEAFSDDDHAWDGQYMRDEIGKG